MCGVRVAKKEAMCVALPLCAVGLLSRVIRVVTNICISGKYICISESQTLISPELQIDFPHENSMAFTEQSTRASAFVHSGMLYIDESSSRP